MISKSIIFVACLLLLPGPNQEALEKPKEMVLESVPDLLQTLKEAKFAGGGSQFCAPVCVSNSLVWLEGKNLAPQYQIEVAKRLSSRAFMNTSLKDGTGTRGLMQGVDRYAQMRWSGYHRLEYAGWRVAMDGKKVANQPTLKWMTDALHRRGAVWVNVGWYKVRNANSAQPTFERTGGHWVTLVGYSKGKLIFHDPAPRAGKQPQQEVVTCKVLGEGVMTGRKKGLPVSSNGFIALGKGMHLSSKADGAIIDGAVVFEMASPKGFRTWESADGKSRVDAELVSQSENLVTLAPKNGGAVIQLKASELSKQDQEHLALVRKEGEEQKK